MPGIIHVRWLNKIAQYGPHFSGLSRVYDYSWLGPKCVKWAPSHGPITSLSHQNVVATKIIHAVLSCKKLKTFHIFKFPFLGKKTKEKRKKKKFLADLL